MERVFKRCNFFPSLYPLGASATRLSPSSSSSSILDRSFFHGFKLTRARIRSGRSSRRDSPGIFLSRYAISPVSSTDLLFPITFLARGRKVGARSAMRAIPRKRRRHRRREWHLRVPDARRKLPGSILMLIFDSAARVALANWIRAEFRRVFFVSLDGKLRSGFIASASPATFRPRDVS